MQVGWGLLSSFLISDILIGGILASPPKAVDIPGKSRAQVAKLLGKPTRSMVHKNHGVVDLYTMRGFSDVRVGYIGPEGKLKPFDARFTFPTAMSLPKALAAAGISAVGITTKTSLTDGSLLVERVPNVPSGWRISFWSETSAPHRAHLDFLSPDHQ